jgi:hypothetical protein
MNSRFLKICEKIRVHLNEQDLSQSQADMNQSNAQADMPKSNNIEASTNMQSALPVVENQNQKIVSLVNGIKNFYADEKKLTFNEINTIKSLPIDTSDDTINKTIDVLIKIFNPSKIDTKPENIENSDYA